MAEKEETRGTTSQETVQDIGHVQHEPCHAVTLLRDALSSRRDKWYDIICEYIITNEDIQREWKCITKHDTTIVLAKCNLSKVFDIRCFDSFILSNYQHISSSIDAKSTEAAATVISHDTCECFNSHSVLKNILNSADKTHWVCFWVCRGQTYLSMGDEQTSIPIEDFNQLDTLVGQLIQLDSDARNILNTRIPLGETENAVGTVTTSHVISQEEFFKELNELVFQKRKTSKQLNTLVIKLCGIVEVTEDRRDLKSSQDGSLNVERPRRNTDGSDELSGGSSIPLRTLLQCIVVRLTPLNWEELRRYVGRDVPSRVIVDIPNNIEFFQELENRDMINIGNTEYIRNGFYEIERVDLVHLLDCIQAGDYSLLTADVATRHRNDNVDRNRLTRHLLGTTARPPPVHQMRNLTVEAGRNVLNTAEQISLWPRAPSQANTQSPVSQTPEVATADGNEAPNLTGNDGSDDTRDRPLQRRYRSVPQRTTPSSPYPVQEQTDGEPASETGTRSSVESSRGQDQNSANVSTDTPAQGTNADGASVQSTNAQATSNQSINSQATNADEASVRNTNTESASIQSSNAEGANAESTPPPGTDVEGTLPQDTNAENSEAWMETRGYSCEHYDRYCHVQFGCCEEFWPCHRCHNAKSQCGERKLRSRDIKKLKCRRCSKVQEFPKESPHCVKCGLKFSEYFCPKCQHMTGVQNHPFHCEKCGICRVHGNRSFHCDVCGVCLDVNLRGNHKCREGSAHDECCVCFEDAFTGCQILPCNHKVHKECANQLIRTGMTRCPICRESFTHKMGKIFKK